ncbi:MAG TPA: hypothetical protein VN898_09915 [Candidatus Binatia bacterium]|nr:hypothetical protein [Candidatus Binatia bacterium]
MRTRVVVGILAGALALPAAVRAAPGAPVAPPADRSEVRFTIGEAALLDLLKAATPYTFNVGNAYLKVDLTLSEPRDLRLLDSKATLKVRLKGSTLPVDQILSPVFTLRHDEALNKYFVVVASLPVQLPGIGSIDLKDSLPRFEIPELIEDLWRFSDRPVALNLDIQRIVVLDHRIEIGADVVFTPAVPGGTGASR